MDWDPLLARAELAVRGARMRVPVQRRGGAGPSDDGHLLLDGTAATIPLVERSPFEIVDGQVFRDGVPLGLAVDSVRRPAFYDLRTADGIPYEMLARLHGRDVLATTVIQTCIRYEPEDRCRFCAIEESLRSRATTAVKTPAQLAEVAEAAVRLDGVRQLVMTTGTTHGPDRGAKHLARCAAAVRAAVPDLPIQVQVEPPRPLSLLRVLRESGATAIGIHVESLDDEVRQRWMPSKGTVPMREYVAAWMEAVRVFGRNRVSTYILLGLGEDPGEVVEGARRLAAMGVYPFVVPFRPLAGTLAAAGGVPAPPAGYVAEVSRQVADVLREAGMRGADQGAGCAACGACGVLSSLGA
jgi:radical SAM protein (TIGR04043 family)